MMDDFLEKLSKSELKTDQMYNEFRSQVDSVTKLIVEQFPELDQYDPYCDYFPGDGLCFGIDHANVSILVPVRFIVHHCNEHGLNLDLDKLKLMSI